MTSTNAPQPTPTAGVAEVFDDTIQQAPPTNSADGGIGPNNIEAPISAGSMNSFDQKYYTHWMTLTHITWDTSAAPGQLLWSIPIHPDRSHQWIAWDAKKYYVWAGGFDFAVKVAGTGFHAGSVMLVRIPPGLKPEQFRTTNDLSGFDWKQIDPKTLEVVSSGIMDQRNIKYHYFPLDLNDKSTFGGHFAIYVMLPLRTSATGVTQISLQVFTRPSRNFTMDQLIPIRTAAPTVTRPVSIEYALNFTQSRTHSLFSSRLTGFTAWSQKSKAIINRETLNCSKFDASPMNSVYLPRLQNVEYFVWKEPNKRISEINSENIVWTMSDAGGDIKVVSIIPEKQGTDAFIYLYKLYFSSSDRDDWYPEINGGSGKLYMTYKKETADALEVTTTFSIKFIPLTDADRANNYTAKIEPIGLKDKVLRWTLGNSDHVPAPADGSKFLSDDNLKWLVDIGLKLEDVSFDLNLTDYAPPISESIITFQSDNGDSAQPFELSEVFRSSQFTGLIGVNESLIFELWDEIADLPIMPIKVAYNGLITTLPQTTDRVFKFNDPERYRMYFIGTQATTTPLSGGAKLLSPKKYFGNMRIASAILQSR